MLNIRNILIPRQIYLVLKSKLNTFQFQQFPLLTSSMLNFSFGINHPLPREFIFLTHTTQNPSHLSCSPFIPCYLCYLAICHNKSLRYFFTNFYHFFSEYFHCLRLFSFYRTSSLHSTLSYAYNILMLSCYCII